MEKEYKCLSSPLSLFCSLFLYTNKHWKSSSNSSPLGVKCINNLQFGCTGPGRNFCILAYIQPQPLFRQRFTPHCLFVARAWQLSGKRPQLWDCNLGHRRASGGKCKNICMCKAEGRANSWFLYQAEVVMIIVCAYLFFCFNFRCPEINLHPYWVTEGCLVDGGTVLHTKLVSYPAHDIRRWPWYSHACKPGL